MKKKNNDCDLIDHWVDPAPRRLAWRRKGSSGIHMFEEGFENSYSDFTRVPHLDEPEIK